MIVAAVVAALMIPAAVSPAFADTASELAAARDQANQAQARANEAAAVLSASEAKAQELGDRIAALDEHIAGLRDRVGMLTGLVRERAVAAYMNRDVADADTTVVFASPLNAARRAKFLDQANQRDDRVMRELEGAREDLADERRDVTRRREEQQQVTNRLEGDFAAAQSAVAAANRARDELAARLEREQAAAAQAEAARLRAEQAARLASAPTPSGGAPAPGRVIVNPGGGAFQCPVQGSSYSDGFGPRGSGFHYGIDMFAPTGTAEVAVKSGYVTYVPMAGAGGNEAYLAADDGNVYYYAHSSQFVGGARRVAQGEVIALVGSTGNASGSHLHFEIRVGGANGQRVDPYPTLQSAGC